MTDSRFVVKHVEGLDISADKLCPLLTSQGGPETCIGSKCAFYTSFDEANIARTEDGEAMKEGDRPVINVKKISGCTMVISQMMVGNANNTLNEMANSAGFQAQMMQHMLMPKTSQKGILTPYGIHPATR